MDFNACLVFAFTFAHRIASHFYIAMKVKYHYKISHCQNVECNWNLIKLEFSNQKTVQPDVLLCQYFSTDLVKQKCRNVSFLKMVWIIIGSFEIAASRNWVSVKWRVTKMNEVNKKIGQFMRLGWSIPLWYWIVGVYERCIFIWPNKNGNKFMFLAAEWRQHEGNR